MAKLPPFLRDITAQNAWNKYLKRANSQSYNRNNGNDTNKNIMEAAIPASLKHRLKNRNQTKGMGLEMFSGELKDATKFMQSKQHPEVVKNAYSILENLKKTGESGQNVDSTGAVGGASNISGALASGASYQAEIAQENAENDENPLEAYLRSVYRDEQAALVEEKLELDPPVVYVALEPIDDEGVETPLYIAWRIVYALTLDDEFIEAYNAYDSGVTLTNKVTV